MNNQDSAIYTMEECANKLRISRTQLYNLINDGIIPAFKMGKKTVFKPKDIEEYINSLSEKKD